jgi:hypothetical protein
VQQAAFFAASMVPAVTPALRGSLYLSATHATEAPTHLAVSGVQQAPAVQEAASVGQFVVAAAVIFWLCAGQIMVSHLAFAVQQAAFFAASVVPAVTPAFAGSLYVSATHMTEAPAHFAVSRVQQRLAVQEAASVGQFVVAAAVICWWVAGQVVNVSHLAFAVQQFSFLFALVVPHVTPALLASRYLSVMSPHRPCARLPHFEASEVQHVPVLQEAASVKHFVSEAAIFIHPHSSERALPAVSAITMANITLPAIFIV